MTDTGTSGPTAGLLLIGDEVLAGSTRDAHLQHIAKALAPLGIPVVEARVVRDDREAIVRALDALRAAYTYVFTTGGIGPTHDDITSDAVASAFGVGIDIDPRARAMLESHYSAEMLNEARLRMARIPDGAELIENPISKAPGFRIGNVFVMAGVPAVMHAMLEGIVPQLKGGRPLLSLTITADMGEGDLAPHLVEVESAHGGVAIGSYPYFRQNGKFAVSVVLRSQDPDALAAAADALKGRLNERGVRHVDGKPLDG
jgi:molybdenum cofactor synthesis domain-containing protein